MSPRCVTLLLRFLSQHTWSASASGELIPTPALFLLTKTKTYEGCKVTSRCLLPAYCDGQIETKTFIKSLGCLAWWWCVYVFVCMCGQVTTQVRDALDNLDLWSVGKSCEDTHTHTHTISHSICMLIKRKCRSF